MKKRIILLIGIFVLVLMLSAFAEAAVAKVIPAVECNDKKDNDGDGKTDYLGGCDTNLDGNLDLVNKTCPVQAQGGSKYYAKDIGCGSANDTTELNTPAKTPTPITTQANRTLALPVQTTCDCCECFSKRNNDWILAKVDGCEGCTTDTSDPSNKSKYTAEGKGCLQKLSLGQLICEEIIETEDKPSLVVPEDDGLPECSDKKDNDGDGKIDYPLDVCCESAIDTSEKGKLASYGTCRDGIDNDGDGLIDFGSDSDCKTVYYPEDPVQSALLYQAAQQNTETTTRADAKGVVDRVINLFRAKEGAPRTEPTANKTIAPAVKTFPRIVS